MKQQDLGIKQTVFCPSQSHYTDQLLQNYINIMKTDIYQHSMICELFDKSNTKSFHGTV